MWNLVPTMCRILLLIRMDGHRSQVATYNKYVYDANLISVSNNRYSQKDMMRQVRCVNIEIIKLIVNETC